MIWGKAWPKDAKVVLPSVNVLDGFQGLSLRKLILSVRGGCTISNLRGALRGSPDVIDIFPVVHARYIWRNTLCRVPSSLHGANKHASQPVVVANPKSRHCTQKPLGFLSSHRLPGPSVARGVIQLRRGAHNVLPTMSIKRVEEAWSHHRNLRGIASWGKPAVETQ